MGVPLATGLSWGVVMADTPYLCVMAALLYTIDIQTTNLISFPLDTVIKFAPMFALI